MIKRSSRLEVGASPNANVQPSKAELNAELDKNLREKRLAKKALEKLRVPPPPQQHKSKKQRKWEERAARRRAASRENKKPDAQSHLDERAAFYASWEWRTLRMEILKQYGHRCQSCGATTKDKTVSGAPVRIVVDHIKPLSKFWDLRLDRNNLQVLCDECNQGKGAWDQTDYRPADPVPEGNVIWGDSWDDLEKSTPN